MKILLFDIDGTLLRAGPGPVRAFDRAFLELYGIAEASAGIELHGRTDRWIVQSICDRRLRRRLAEEELELLCTRYVEHYHGTIAESDGFSVLPGVSALLGRLAAEPHVLLGVQTGNLERSAHLKLSHAGLRSYFSFGGYGSDHVERPEIVRIALERARTIRGLREGDVEAVVIGDSPHDIAAGKAVGALTVGVATGKSDAAELAAAGCDLLLESFEAPERLLALAAC